MGWQPKRELEVTGTQQKPLRQCHAASSSREGLIIQGDVKCKQRRIEVPGPRIPTMNAISLQLIRVRKCGTGSNEPTVAASTVSAKQCAQSCMAIKENLDFTAGREATKNYFQATKHVSQFRRRSGPLRHLWVQCGDVTWRRSTAGGQRKLRRRMSSQSMERRTRPSTRDSHHVSSKRALTAGRWGTKAAKVTPSVTY